MNWSPNLSEQQNVRQPRAAWILMAAWFFQGFAIFASTQIIIHFISMRYALSAAMVDNMYNALFAIMGIGQILMAFMADRYLGWLRTARLSAGLGLIAMVGFASFMSSQAPTISYQGQSYETRLMDSNAGADLYLIVDTVPIAIEVMDTGDLQLAKAFKSLPTRIPAEEWSLSTENSMGMNILLFLLVLIFVASRCFGLPIVYAVLGACYPGRDNARLIGFCALYIVMNMSVVGAYSTQVWMVAQWGQKNVMLLASLAMLCAYLLLRFDRGVISSYAGMTAPVDRVVTQKGYILLGWAFTGIIAIIAAVSLGLKEAQDYLQILINMPQLPNWKFGTNALFFAYASVLSCFLMYSYKKESKALFYALLCVCVFSILRIVYECMFNIGIDNIKSFGENFVDHSPLAFIGFTTAYIPLLGSIMISTIGTVGLLMWIAMRHNFAPMGDLIKCFIAFGMVGAAYMVLSIGTHDLLPNNLSRLGYFAVASMLIPMAEFLITPTLIASVYRVRQLSMPATSLAIFISSMSFSNQASQYVKELMEIKTVSPTTTDIVAKQLEYGNVFLATGTLGLVGAIFILFALLPIITRWMAIANAPTQPKPRPEIQMTGFDRY